MRKHFTTLLLVAALLLPVLIFLSLWIPSHASAPVAAALAIATGWALNVAWAFASRGGAPGLPSSDEARTLSIAVRFGWACPAVLVLLSWGAWRLAS